MATHWDKYWSEGHLTSFCNDFSANYEDEYSEFWIQHYAELADGSKALDIATGNLAVPLLVSRTERLQDVELYAADLSKISKEKISKQNNISIEQLETISLYEETNIEEMPFADNYFEMISSMYGFEYANIEKVIAESSRVLKPGGRFVAISHRDDSVILVRNNAAMECMKELLYQNKVLDILQSFSKAIGFVASPADAREVVASKKVAKQKKLLHKANLALYTKYGDVYQNTGLPTLIQSFMSRIIGSKESERAIYLKSQVAEQKAHLTRLKDLNGAALTEQKAKQLTKAAERNGLQLIRLKGFQRHDKLVGSQIILEKPNS